MLVVTYKAHTLHSRPSRQTGEHTAAHLSAGLEPTVPTTKAAQARSLRLGPPPPPPPQPMSRCLVGRPAGRARIVFAFGLASALDSTTPLALQYLLLRPGFLSKLRL